MENSISIYNDLLSLNKKIIIPEYQREYSWSKEDIEVFLEDIQKAIEDNNIFYLGTIYVYTPKDKNEIHIIDGQQRLTTIIIFLYIIMEKFIKEETNFLYLEDGTVKIIADNEALNSAYQYSFYEVFDEFEEETKNSLIEDNLKIVESKLNELSKGHIEKIYKVLKEEIKINVVSVSKLKDAMNIFMNLNARGKELSAIEIIKSNIFSYILDLDADKYFLKELKNKFNRLLYNTESKSYNDNLKNFKKNLYLYICYKDIDMVRNSKLKEGTSDKVFSSIFMKILLNNFNFQTLIGIKNFMNEFEQFTNTYIWWNLTMIKKYKPTDIEKKYREKYKNINKAKTTDIATLISFSDTEKDMEEGYHRVLEAFSIIELKKVYNKYILKMEDSKISLSIVEKDMVEMIKRLKNNDLRGFMTIFNSEEYTFERKKLEELKNYILENNTEDFKDLETIKSAMENIKNSGMLR